MSNPQKSLTITILKVYNWNEKDTEEAYDFSFYQILSKGLILQKIIKPHVSNNQLIINTSLKITFTPEESQILLKMNKINEGKDATFINQFLIDLQLLDQRKIQYLPFDKNDKILEVVNDTISREDKKSQNSVMIRKNLDNFIHQKSSYLKYVSSQNGSKVWEQQRIQPNHSFTQKIYALLQETRRLREKFERQKKKQDQGPLYNYQRKDSDKLSMNTDEIGDQRLLVKSNSENLLNIPHNSRIQDTVKKERGVIVNKRWSIVPQYKLDLRNLTIIDLSNQRDEIIQDDDEVLRSKQENFSAFKNNHHQYSAYLPKVHQKS